ncbi:MAG: DUF998 domain-containing protein [Angustibacter sp.]
MATTLTTTTGPATRADLAARAGLVAGPLFVSVALLLTWLEWDFLHAAGWRPFADNVVPYPSYTALGRFGVLQMVSFFLTGACVVAFVQALGRHLHGRLGAIGRALLTLTGVAIMTSTFPTDRVPVTHASWHGVIHAVSFFAVLLTSLLGMLFTGLALRRATGWRRWGTLTAWLPLWQLLCFTVIGGLLPGDSGFYLFVLGLFTWVFATARQLVSAAD